MEPRMNLFANPLGAAIGKRIYATNTAIKESSLPEPVQELVQLRASQINGCGFCVDIHTKNAEAADETSNRLNLVAAWRHTTVFTAAERAALALTEEATRIADAAPGVSDATWDAVRAHYDDDQAVALVSLIAMINAANRLSVILNYQGGSYEPGKLAAIAG
ncbi:carboxymuconolactone decarboxylase family protein [Streptomyces profundus]|uniref:carboxymuconolactone decarboxylase family protein n=1 Tax=Streptomyces profundus TaxID=2867410 RepID=UPI001D169D3A|nr:carboxymuconolactone decarboxylase family protein [Streptomyces sp. MA3_2.13]UED84856.1 carboxymuconolactone decarboxylase family protein [Streptomyces sp. MA3_2.13]